jgi:hypothetical protein
MWEFILFTLQKGCKFTLQKGCKLLNMQAVAEE